MFLDDYSLEKSLGKGAFGEVYLTTKKGTNKLYATKKIERELVESGNTMKYLTNEILILKELNHPNIVKFEEIKKTKNHYYIIMEYCNGGELYKTLEKYMDKYKKPFSQEIVQNLMRQIVNAFKYIHGKKIIHRDIKLENILLNYDSEEDKKNLNILKAQVKIIDFGFAAKLDKSGLKYTALGSPINMDPIILNKLRKRGKKNRELGYDQKADIWSLGTICYEMLIGKCVFNAEDLEELVEKVENGTYSVPTTLSKEVISFLNGMLQYDASTRLNIDQLANHVFLNKNVKDFHSIDMKKVSKNLDKSKLKINVKQNKSIWAIFNKEDEDKLLRISAKEFDKPISEENNINNKNINNLNNSINKNIIPKMQNNNIPNDNRNVAKNNDNRNIIPNNNNLNNNAQNNHNKNNTVNNNKINYEKIKSNEIKEKQNLPINNPYKNMRSVDSLPLKNLPYAYTPQNYAAMPAYPGMAAVPLQGRMVTMPVMGYPQMQPVQPMQPVQGYAMPTGYAYNVGYYK